MDVIGRIRAVDVPAREHPLGGDGGPAPEEEEPRVRVVVLGPDRLEADLKRVAFDLRQLSLSRSR